MDDNFWFKVGEVFKTIEDTCKEFGVRVDKIQITDCGEIAIDVRRRCLDWNIRQPLEEKLDQLLGLTEKNRISISLRDYLYYMDD